MKQNVVDDLTEENYTVLNSIEQMALGELDANLGFKFDIYAALKANNAFLKMMLIDLFAYHLSSRMTHISMQEIREVRYSKAQDWLRDCAMGKIVPNLPMKDKEAGEYKSENLYITSPRITGAW